MAISPGKSRPTLTLHPTWLRRSMCARSKAHQRPLRSGCRRAGDRMLSSLHMKLLFAFFLTYRPPNTPIDQLRFENREITRFDAIHEQNQILALPSRARRQYAIEAQKKSDIADFLTTLIA